MFDLLTKWSNRALIVSACCFCVAAVVSASSVCAQESIDDLLKNVPPSANALMLIDAEQVMKTPYAVKQGWQTESMGNFQAKPLTLPPEAKQIVVASNMNPNQNFQQAYELAVMSLLEPLSMRSIARAEGGYVDMIGKTEAVWSPAGAYFFKMSDDVVAAMFPPNRQAVARLAQQVQSSKQQPAISAYLQDARLRFQPGTQIVMAFDLDDSVQPHELQANLAASELIGDDDAKRKNWQTTILGLRGLTFAVALTDKAAGELTIDFDGGAEVFAGDAKTVILSVFEKYGISIDELQDWKASSTSSTLSLSGDLSEAGMRKIFSLLEIPSANFSNLKDEQPVPEDDTETVGQASLKYFKSIDTLLSDLQNEFRTNRDARRSNAPVYMERYARKIDRLPILNVDPILLEYGSMVAETLRSASVTTRTAGVNTGIQKSSVYGNYSYAYNGYGYGTAVDAAATKANARNAIEREEQGQARIERFSSGKEIADATAEIRRQMTRKYMLEF